MDNYMYFDLGQLIQPDRRPAAEHQPITFTELDELGDIPPMPDSTDTVLDAAGRKTPPAVLPVSEQVSAILDATQPDLAQPDATAENAENTDKAENAENTETVRTRFEAIRQSRPNTVTFKPRSDSEYSRDDSDHDDNDNDNDDVMFSPAREPAKPTQPPKNKNKTKPPLPYITPRKIMLPYFVVCLFIFVILTIPLSRVKNKYAWTIWTTAFVAAFIDFFIYVNNNPCGHRLSEIPPSEGYECDGPYERNAKLSARVVYHIIWAVLLLVLLIVAIKLAMPIVWLVVLLAVVMCVGGSFVYHFVFFGRYSIDPHDAKHPVQYYKSGDVTASSAHCWYKSCDS